MEVIKGLRGINAGKVVTVEQFDIHCRNLLHTVSPLVGNDVDVTEEDVKKFMQMQIDTGIYRSEKIDG